jgi:hypothetical protein
VPDDFQQGDRWDEILDSGLANYSAAEPLAGLEERVLGRVRGAVVRRTRVWIWAWAGAAVCLVLFCFSWLKPDHAAAVAVRAAAPTRSLPALAVSRTVRRVRPKRPRVVALPRLAEEEVLLVRLAATDPNGAVRAFASLNEAVNRDITPEPLIVKPIEIESLDGEKKNK